MKIILEFNSIEEMQQSIQKLEQFNFEREVGVTAMEEDKKAVEVKKAKKAKKEEPEEVKASEPESQEPQEEPKEEAKKEEPKVDYDALRVECRKVMAALNKATGKNTASEIIKGHGADKLSMVENRRLPALLEEAKEALADAE